MSRLDRGVYGAESVHILFYVSDALRAIIVKIEISSVFNLFLLAAVV